MQVGLDGLQTVVTGRPPADLEFHPPHGQVELVVDDHEAAQVLDAVPANEGGHRQP